MQCLKKFLSSFSRRTPEEEIDFILDRATASSEPIPTDYVALYAKFREAAERLESVQGVRALLGKLLEAEAALEKEAAWSVGEIAIMVEKAVRELDGMIDAIQGTIQKGEKAIAEGEKPYLQEGERGRYQQALASLNLAKTELEQKKALLAFGTDLLFRLHNLLREDQAERKGIIESLDYSQEAASLLAEARLGRKLNFEPYSPTASLELASIPSVCEEIDLRGGRMVETHDLLFQVALLLEKTTPKERASTFVQVLEGFRDRIAGLGQMLDPLPPFDASGILPLLQSLEQKAGEARSKKPLKVQVREALKQDADPIAQCQLADQLRRGQGCEVDYKIARKLYACSAEKGHANAQHWLGRFYINGWGVKKDYKKAVEWFQKAAEQENADAQNMLGRCYTEGWGVEKDPKKALEWFQKAVEQGHVFSKQQLEKLEKK